MRKLLILVASVAAALSIFAGTASANNAVGLINFQIGGPADGALVYIHNDSTGANGSTYSTVGVYGFNGLVPGNHYTVGGSKCMAHSKYTSLGYGFTDNPFLMQMPTITLVGTGSC